MNGEIAMTLTSETGVRPPAGAFRMTPARWVTLAIGVPLILALIGWTGFSVVSQSVRGSFTVSYALPVQHGQLTASVESGDLNVRPGRSGTTAHLAGTVDYGLFRPHVTRTTTASGTAVDVNCAALNSGNCGLSAILDVPPLTSLTLSTGGGNLTVPGVAQAVNLTSDGGDVTVSGIPGGTEVSSGGGNLTASGLSGTLKFTTDGGDINGNDLAAPTINAGSGGGNVTLVFTTAPRYLDITSDGGDVTVLLPHDGTAYNVSTTPDGGDDNVSVGTTGSQAADQVIVGSGGGNISVAYAN
jgi:Putative adhesin